MKIIGSLLIAARPKTLLASFSPVILGVSLALKSDLKIINDFYLVAFLITGTAILIQILCNFINDLWDFYKGSDSINRIGPKRAVSSGLISPQKMKLAIYFLTAIIILLGTVLVCYGGSIIFFIGVLSLIGAYIYTAGPYPLAYNGLGELFVLIFFGPVPVFGTFYLLTNKIDVKTAILGLPLGLIATAILLTNNIRDFKEDSNSSKRTLAVKFGLPFSKILFSSSLLLASILPLILLPKHHLLPLSLFSVIVITISLILIKQLLSASKGADYNRLLGEISFYLFIFSLGFSTIISV